MNENLAEHQDLSNESDIEKEDLGAIQHPFDPSKIRVRTWTPTVYNLMERLKHGELDLAPEFQRRAGIWDNGQQSRLIESLLIRIPLPAFYLDELPLEGGLSEKYAVVDGVQRLTVLDRFINKDELKLQDLEFLQQLKDKKYSELDSSLQRRIQETQLSVNVVEPGTPDEAKLNIFKRINTGGVGLTAQEIRHAMSPGPVRAWLKELSENSEFRDAIGLKIAETFAERMEDRECVIRFVAFLDDGVKSYQSSDPNFKDFDTFLLQAMARVNQLTDEGRFRIGRRFIRAMEAAKNCFGQYAFRKLGADGRRGKLNKTLFEATAVNLDLRNDNDLSVLMERKELLIEKYKEALKEKAFLDSVTTGTGDPSRVQRRFNALNMIISETLK